MQQHGVLQRGVCRNTLASSSRPRLSSQACRAVQRYTHSRLKCSSQHQAAHTFSKLAHHWSYTASSSSSSTPPAISGWQWLQAAALALLQLHLALAGNAAELVEANISSEGNIPSELSAAGEVAAPALSSLMAGSNRKQVEGCTSKCVPTCIRGGEGAPGLGPLSLRREMVVFKSGFRSRQYCLSECAQVCSLRINKDSSNSSSSQQQQQQQQQPPDLRKSTAVLAAP